MAGAARADPWSFDPGAVNRPLTVPKGLFFVTGVGGARHLPDGEVFVASSLTAVYGVTNNFQLSLSALAVEYAPTARLLLPSGGATYAFLDSGGVQMGASLNLGGVWSPTVGALIQPSLPIAFVAGRWVRLEMGPQFPIVVAKKPVVGVVAPLSATFRFNDALHTTLSTAASLNDVTSHSITIPAKLSFGYARRAKIPFAITPFFAFPTLFTPGDVSRHVHTNDYAAGVALATWYQR